jgi:hypothetical protein
MRRRIANETPAIRVGPRIVVDDAGGHSHTREPLDQRVVVPLEQNSGAGSKAIPLVKGESSRLV